MWGRIIWWLTTIDREKGVKSINEKFIHEK